MSQQPLLEQSSILNNTKQQMQSSQSESNQNSPTQRLYEFKRKISFDNAVQTLKSKKSIQSPLRAKSNFSKGGMEPIAQLQLQYDNNNEQANNNNKNQDQNYRIQQQILNRQRQLYPAMNFNMRNYFRTTQRNFDTQQTDKLFANNLGDNIFTNWLLLLLTILISAFSDAWIFTSGNLFALGFAWRQALSLIYLGPLAIRQFSQKHYSLAFLRTLKYWRKMTFSSLLPSFWCCSVTILIKTTTITEVLYLSSLTCVWFSCYRTYYYKNIKFQRAGLGIVILTLVSIILYYIIVYDPAKSTQNRFDQYYQSSGFLRAASDLAALLLALINVAFSYRSFKSHDNYPQYLNLTIHAGVTCMFTLILVQFIGANWSQDSYNGIFGLFTQRHLLSYLIITIVTGCGSCMSIQLLENKLKDPMVPSLTSRIQPIITSLFVNLLRFSAIPGPFISYCLALSLPGVIIILLSDCITSRNKYARTKKLSILQIAALKDRAGGVLKFQR